MSIGWALRSGLKTRYARVRESGQKRSSLMRNSSSDQVLGVGVRTGEIKLERVHLLWILLGRRKSIRGLRMAWHENGPQRTSIPDLMRRYGPSSPVLGITLHLRTKVSPMRIDSSSSSIMSRLSEARGLACRPRPVSGCPIGEYRN